MQTPVLSTTMGKRDYFLLRYFAAEDRFDVVDFARGYGGAVYSNFTGYPTGTTHKIFVNTAETSFITNQTKLYRWSLPLTEPMSGSQLTPGGISGSKTWWLACDAANSTMVVVDQGSGRVYVSTDGGDNWTEKQPQGDAGFEWAAAGISSDGAWMLVVQGSSVAEPNPARKVWLSEDSGESWTDVTPPCDDPHPHWLHAWVSTDHSRLITYNSNPGTPSYRQLFRRVDGTWEDITIPGTPNILLLVASNDCMKILAADPTARIYGTVDGGDTWVETQPVGDIDAGFVTLSMSRNGSVWGCQAADVIPYRSYTSGNLGVNWIGQDFAGNGFASGSTGAFGFNVNGTKWLIPGSGPAPSFPHSIWTNRL